MSPAERAVARWIERRLTRIWGSDVAEGLVGDLVEEGVVSWRLIRVLLFAELRWTLDRGRTFTREVRTMLRQDLVLDFKLAGRGFRRSPGFFGIATVILGVGIGAATTVYSVADSVLWRPLPYPSPDRLYKIGSAPFEERLAGAVFAIAPRMLDEWQGALTSFENVAGRIRLRMTLTGAGEPLLVNAAAVSVELRSTLGIRMATGRWFAPAHNVTGGERVVVLDHGFWQDDFGGDPDIVGRTLTLDGRPHTVIGVLHRHFRGPESVDLADVQAWLPIAQSGRDLNELNNWYVDVLAHLRPETGVGAAFDELESVSNRALEEWTGSGGFRPAMKPLVDLTVGDVASTMWILLGASGILLLTACANVAHLMLARSASRHRELAVRVALGAGQARIVRQILIESLMLAAAGAALGLGLSYLGVAAFRAIDPGRIPRIAEVGVHPRVLILSLILAATTGVVFGIAPAMMARRRDLRESLHSGARGSQDRAGTRMRTALVSVETAMASVMLIGAALLANSFLHLIRVDPGLNVENRVEIRLVARSAHAGRDALTQYFNEIRLRLNSIPGVSRAALTVGRPFGSAAAAGTYVVEGQPVAESRYMPWQLISHDYFETIGARITAGRDFDPADMTRASNVVIVNEALDREILDGEALGHRIKIIDDDESAPWLTIIGVVADISPGNLAQRAEPVVYLPYTLPRFLFPSVSFVVESSLGIDRLAAGVRAAVWDVDGSQAISSIATLESRISESLSESKFYLILLGGFGIISLVLAASGVYGTISYAVAQRRRELGIRIALGATGSRIRTLILRQGFVPTAAGVAAGLVAAAALSRFIESFVYGIQPTDASTYGFAALILFIAAATACLVPAGRAARTDPVEALRDD